MQTLTPGSFIKLENSESVEALKFTARRLAEHTATVATAENLPPSTLTNLSNNLWEKAEYVARETERRRLQEIFTENFTERFRELKPEISLEDALISEVLSAASTIGNGGSVKNAPEIGEENESEAATTESASVVSPQRSEETEAQEKRDEFLGFVKTDEPFTDAQVAETESAATTTAPDETERETILSAGAPASETLKPEDESATILAAVTNSESEQVSDEQEVPAENVNEEKSLPPATAEVTAGNDSQVGNANKTNASKTETKEPFEFGKCTINLNLILLPSSGDSTSRKAIVSAASHNLPPEIEFLEIGSGEDLTEIARLVQDKLARFKQTLPAKYIEQLRASKTKSVKKLETAKTSTTAVNATTKPAMNQPNAEKTSGSQTAQVASDAETEKSRAEITAAKETAPAFPAPVAAVPQSVPANNVQPSLF